MWGGFCLISACSILFLSSFFHLLCSSLNLTRIVCSLFCHAYACVCVAYKTEMIEWETETLTLSISLCGYGFWMRVLCGTHSPMVSHSTKINNSARQAREWENGRIISAHKKNFDGSFGFGFLYSYCIILIFNRILYKSNVEKRDFRFYFLVLISHPPNSMTMMTTTTTTAPTFIYTGIHTITHGMYWMCSTHMRYSLFTQNKRTQSTNTSSSLPVPPLSHTPNGK